MSSLFWGEMISTRFAALDRWSVLFICVSNIAWMGIGGNWLFELDGIVSFECQKRTSRGVGLAYSRGLGG